MAQEYLEDAFLPIWQETLYLFYLFIFIDYSKNKGGYLMKLMNPAIKENFLCFPRSASRPSPIQPSPVVASRYNIEIFQLCGVF